MPPVGDWNPYGFICLWNSIDSLKFKWYDPTLLWTHGNKNRNKHKQVNKKKKKKTPTPTNPYQTPTNMQATTLHSLQMQNGI